MEIQKKIIRSVFSVAEKKYLTPHYIRILFAMTETQMEDFRNITIGANNKIFIPVKGAAEEVTLRRTYTTRNIDWKTQTLWIDFVAHGDNSPASAWAINAQKGDTLEIAMKDSKRPLVPERDNYLLIGDMTAMPVIAAILEQLPAHAKAEVILEVYHNQDEMNLVSKADVTLTWLHNRELDHSSRLADTVKSNPLPLSHSFVFIAAESDAVKELKTYFRDKHSWGKENCSITSYWKRGRSEDESGNERAMERQG
ncbi:NADPH-dependent ferric siderophore reductase [Pedobacter africanus]|uniref:NADPH-dependent ferric siderophore reductase n=1 Tax=Pedobacter africanus TaxID=151894 RepID=A0ACC6L2J1_9SPHI|nr:siderophore-interacting protein [Pedobacter africanus]MDR6785630.1 NADPH-dependent ferric siderophore reductase [Pedobacter africanus]